VIVTLTPNPSLDRTLELDRLDRGSVLRARKTRVEPGGKGVNVARALLANGHPVRAVLPVGGPEGDHLAALLDALGLDVRTVPIAAPIRSNVSLVEPNGTVTKINAPGPRLQEDESDSLKKATVAALDGARWVAACGSLPPGASVDLYASLVRDVHDAGVVVALDTSGAPLAEAVAAGPDLIKPNAHELAAVAQRRLATFGDVVAAAGELRRRGGRAVLVTLGRDGAVLVDDDGAVHAETPPLIPRSNVGAGDATLAGFLGADGAGRDALRRAVAWGAAAAGLPGTAMPGPDDIDTARVRIHEVDHDRRLSETGGGR
jgi:1-phosphofructokinase